MFELSPDDLDGDSLARSGDRRQILSHEEYVLEPSGTIIRNRYEFMAYRRAELLPRHGLEVAAQPIRAQLEELRGLIEERFDSVNRHILAGENAFFRVQEGRTVWDRAVRTQESLPNEPFF